MSLEAFMKGEIKKEKKAKSLEDIIKLFDEFLGKHEVVVEMNTTAYYWYVGKVTIRLRENFRGKPMLGIYRISLDYGDLTLTIYFDDFRIKKSEKTAEIKTNGVLIVLSHEIFRLIIRGKNYQLTLFTSS